MILSKLFASIAIFIMSLFVLSLLANNDIGLFIHPRYFTLTRVMAGISLCFSFLGAVYYGIELIKRKTKFKEMKIEKGVLLGFILLITFAAWGAIYPLKPISSATLLQRSSEINSVQNDIEIDRFTTNPAEFDIAEWNYLFQTDPNWQSYVGEKVDLEGFVYWEEGYPEDYFMVSRFIISCCAVDARPVGILVSKEWKKEYKLDQWVNVTGELDLVEINGVETIVIIPSEIKQIEIPDNPYIY